MKDYPTLFDEDRITHRVISRDSHTGYDLRVSATPWRPAKAGEINGVLMWDSDVITCLPCVCEWMRHSP